MVSKEEWVLWKSDPVTQAFYEAARERVEECKEILANSAGLDEIQDNFYRGFIFAYREMFDFRVEESDEN